MIQRKISRYKNDQRIQVAVDCVIFGFDGSRLNVLLIKRSFEPEKGKWSLVGGFVGNEENADEAAIRILHDLTGMDHIYMELFYTFSDVDRDTSGRVISIAYFALINVSNFSEQLLRDHEAKWFPLDKIPTLIFDHRRIVLKGKESLRRKFEHYPIGFNLLPKKFTLPQLQNLYEAIYEAPLDRRNLRKKMGSLGILTKLNEKEKKSSRKGAFYYVFDTVKYRKLQSSRVKFI
jgi:8-oxo-dGTP diphosphatase